MNKKDALYRSTRTLATELTNTQKILNKLDAITAMLATLHNDLALSIYHLDEVEKYLNIFTIISKKAAELNEVVKAEGAMKTDT
ncbi:15959_t:CDS:1, partial [Funneliformis caledonium]